MALKPHQRMASAVIPAITYDKLERIARAKGYTMHAFHQRLLINLARRTDIPDEVEHPADGKVQKFSEKIAVEINLDLAMRLQSAARQMRDAKGDPLQPSELARMLLVHECQRETDIVLKMNEQVDPEYVDIVPFTGKTYMRLHMTWHLLAIRCAFETKQAVLLYAQSTDQTQTQVVRSILDARLPGLPGGPPSMRG